MPGTIPEISIVVPLYNEADVVEELFLLIETTMLRLNRNYEIIFVDDGSSDDTLARILTLDSSRSPLQVLTLKGNSGQTAALAAGFDHARGKIIVSMDGDLQHDPREIPLFIKEIDAGYDIVSGWREQRVDPFITRKLPSRIANLIMAKWSGIPLHDFGTTFKAYTAQTLKHVTLYGQFHRFIPALVEGMTPSIKEIPIRSLPRKSGTSKYNLTRTFTVFFDLIRIRFLTRYLNRPLQVFGSIGFVLGFIGFAIAFYLSVLKLATGISIMDYRAPLFLLSILFMLMGSQFLTLGLLGEIIVKLFYRLPGTKIYTVDAVYDLSFGKKPGSADLKE